MKPALSARSDPPGTLARREGCGCEVPRLIGQRVGVGEVQPQIAIARSVCSTPTVKTELPKPEIPATRAPVRLPEVTI